MINLDLFETDVKKSNIKNSYIFCGLDEELIKEGVSLIKEKVVEDAFEDLNYVRIDGMNTTFSDIQNACETLPLMSERKLVVVYRANFLKEKADRESGKLYTEMLKYLKDMPSHTVLIMYFLFNDKRDTPKKSKKITALDKLSTVVHFDKLKKDKLYKKVETIFNEADKQIGKVELRYFCEKVPNNFDIIRREVDKLVNYTNGREIARKDIDLLLPKSSEDDIFDLVDFISQRKVEKALDLMDELLFKADQHLLILASIQSHFKRLYEIKGMIEQRKSPEEIARELRLPTFICDKLRNQANKFNIKQLEDLMKIGLESEKRLKSSTIDKKTEMELMLFKTFMLK